MRLLSMLWVSVIVATTAGVSCADEPKGSWITFLSHRSGGNLLYKMHPEGGEATPIFGGTLKDMPGIPEGKTLYREPHWTRLSPDRRYFLSWACDKWEQTPAHFMLYLGRLEGGPVRVIAAGTDELFAWSPDSEQFAYAVHSVKSRREPGVAGNCPSTQVIVVGVDGSNERVVLEQPGWWHVQDWTPDGRKLLLAFSPTLSLRYGTTELLEFDLAKLETERAEAIRKRRRWEVPSPSDPGMDAMLTVLTGGQHVNDFQDGRYSPDGKKIATIISRHLQTPKSEFDPRGFELAVFDIADARLRIIAKPPEGLRGPICWSPDGQEILFSRYLVEDDQREQMGGGLGIWSIRPDGTDARFITTGWSVDWR